jgi:hypothetical protein
MTTDINFIESWLGCKLKWHQKVILKLIIIKETLYSYFTKIIIYLIK